MSCSIEVLFTPAEFRALRPQHLGDATCVVFDVLRATSTMVTALANGATGFIPVEGIDEALALRESQPNALLAGERGGFRIRGAMTGGVEFDLGNSPREFTREKVHSRTIISTTTNGTRALRACASAATVAIGSFLNFSATVDFLVQRAPRRLLLVCSGTGEQAALEDTLAAGAFCQAIAVRLASCERLDSAEIALRAYCQARDDLREVIQNSQNGRRLMNCADLCEDVEFCLQRDSHPIVAAMGPGGIVGRVEPTGKAQ
jgi:2-phosphosulfolactate phosphatase